MYTRPTDAAGPSRTAQVRSALHVSNSLPVARIARLDRVSLTLVAVFLFAAAFYLWRASVAVPLALHGSQTSPYNQLADAFLRFHLWVVHVPVKLLAPEAHSRQPHAALASLYPDYALYGRYLYLTWGPAPVLALLVPLHLLGFEPSDSVIITPFAIAGLAFALATLRVILRQVGEVPLWVCVLAALTLAYSSVVSYLVRSPQVYHEAIAGGYCFAMAGIWLAVSAIANRRASLTRLALMSLCFGLAAGCRPPLGLTALVLIPVYKAFASTRPRRGLLAALVLPVSGCFMLLAAYDQARFGNPLEYGTKYQLNLGGHWGGLSYVPPGIWSYLITPPRLGILFPFLSLIYPQVSYPLSLPVHYAPISEETGGLLAMTPIAIFLVALPWMWRRRPAPLGSLIAPLLVMASAGLALLLFLSYEFFATTERYEVDYTTLLLLGALAAWLALCSGARARSRRLVRAGGGLLAAWSCLTGLAISFQALQGHPSTWRTLVNLGSPLSTAIVALAGHPVLAEVDAEHVLPSPLTASYANLGSDATGFWLNAGNEADLTIVSPDSREVTLVGSVFGGAALRAGASLEARIGGPGRASRRYQLPTGGEEAQIPLRLSRGVNQLVLSPVASAVNRSNPSAPESQVLMAVTQLHLAGG